MGDQSGKKWPVDAIRRGKQQEQPERHDSVKDDPQKNSHDNEQVVVGVEPFRCLLQEEIDKQVALLKLQTAGIKIDKLTAEQRKYLASWEMGT